MWEGNLFPDNVFDILDKHENIFDILDKNEATLPSFTIFETGLFESTIYHVPLT